MTVTRAASLIGQAIPWLDSFQRGRGLEGDMMVLGIGDGEVMMALGAQTQPGERFVIIDTVNPAIVSEVKRHTRGRDLIIINEDPMEAISSEAMELEKGQYRLVAIDCQGKWDTHVLLSNAQHLLGSGGMVLLSPWVNEEEEGEGVKAGYWWYMRGESDPLRRCGHVGTTLLLTNDRAWQRDYEAVLDGLMGVKDE